MTCFFTQTRAFLLQFGSLYTQLYLLRKPEISESRSCLNENLWKQCFLCLLVQTNKQNTYVYVDMLMCSMQGEVVR